MATAKKVAKATPQKAVKKTVKKEAKQTLVESLQKYVGTELTLGKSQYKPKVVAVFNAEHKGLRVRLAWDINGTEAKKNYIVCKDCLKEGKLNPMKVFERKDGNKFAKCMNDGEHSVPLFSFKGNSGGGVKSSSTAKPKTKLNASQQKAMDMVKSNPQMAKMVAMVVGK